MIGVVFHEAHPSHRLFSAPPALRSFPRHEPVSVAPAANQSFSKAGQGVIYTTLLALALAGCQTIKPLPPTGRVIPCSTVAEVAVNAEAIDHLSDRAARQLLGNDRVIGELCRKKK